MIPASAPPSTPERESAAAKDYAVLQRLLESRKFSELSAAAKKFEPDNSGTKFLEEKADELRSMVSIASDGQSIDKGLLGYWKFDEGAGAVANDSSGQNHHGKLQGHPAWGSGKFGRALGFNGKDDCVILSTSDKLDHLSEGEFSFSAWVNPEDIPPGAGWSNTSRYAIFMKQGNHEGLFFDRRGLFIYEHWLGNDAVSVISNHVFAPGVYHHVVVTLSRGGGQLYVDGVLDGESRWFPNQAPRGYGAEPWKIGVAAYSPKGCVWRFRGAIDEVRVYSRKLSADEVGILAEVPIKKLLTQSDSPGSAKFIAMDDKTHGNWKGVYGFEGMLAYGEYPKLPAFAHVYILAAGYTWAAASKDQRALARLPDPDPRSAPKSPDPDRILGCWHSDTGITVDVNLTDARTHRVALYCVETDSHRVMKIEVQDMSGKVLDTQNVADFGAGRWLAWDVKGHVHFQFIKVTDNPVLSGVFLGSQ